MNDSIEVGYYLTGELRYKIPWINGQEHGIQKYYNRSGEVKSTFYYLYGNKVTVEEYREDQLIKELAKL